MQIDEFLKLVKRRRSIRKFKSDPIPDEYVEKMIDAARFAQSGGNAQPWEFIVVKDDNAKKKIVDIYEQQIIQTWQIERTREKELRQPAYKEGPHKSSFGNAPVFIIIGGDPRAVQASVLSTHFIHNEGGPMAHFLKNIANATQILMLAATALDLGAQWVSINSVMEVRLRALLGIPDELALHTLVPVGYPLHKPLPIYRRELKDMIHYERFDSARTKSPEDSYRWLIDMKLRSLEAYKILHHPKK